MYNIYVKEKQDKIKADQAKAIIQEKRRQQRHRSPSQITNYRRN